MSCSIHAALKERKSVLALSLEMSNGQLIDRAVASVGKIPLNMIRNGTACEEYGTELGAASRDYQHVQPVLADKPALNTIGRVRAMARRHKMRYGLDMLMVDYLQLMDGEGENRVNVISSISRGFKLLANELGVPVILPSQLPESVRSASTSARSSPTSANPALLSRTQTSSSLSTGMRSTTSIPSSKGWPRSSSQRDAKLKRVRCALRFWSVQPL